MKIVIDDITSSRSSTQSLLSYCRNPLFRADGANFVSFVQVNTAAPDKRRLVRTKLHLLLLLASISPKLIPAARSKSLHGYVHRRIVEGLPQCSHPFKQLSSTTLAPASDGPSHDSTPSTWIPACIGFFKPGCQSQYETRTDMESDEHIYMCL